MAGAINKDLSAFAVDYTATYKKPTAKLFIPELAENTDVSTAIQLALDEAAKDGGVVYIPAGVYRLEHPLTVPAGVELRGASSVATRDQSSYSAGTLLQCYYGDDASNGVDDQAFITLAGDYAGINGIRIVYPENSPYDDLNTTFTVRGTAKGVYMVNSMIAASAYGVDFRGCDEHFIKKVTTCCYFNTFTVGGKGGIITGCLQNGTAICRTEAPNLENWLLEENLFTDLYDPITRQTTQYIIVDGATDQLIYNTFIYGCANMLINRNSEGTLAVNIGADNIGSAEPFLIMENGSMTVINAMRYNGLPLLYEDGSLALYNRITINLQNEKTEIYPR